MIQYKCPECARERFVDLKMEIVICHGCQCQMVEVPEVKVNTETKCENDPFSQDPKSSVKIRKMSKGIAWDIKIVTGEEGLIDGLMEKAVAVHKKLEGEFK